MSRAFVTIAAGLAAVVSAAALSAQPPAIANASVTSQPAGESLARTVQSIAASRDAVAWIGYAVPVVDGERVMCCAVSGTTWINGDIVMGDGSDCCATCRLEPSTGGAVMSARPTGTQPPGVVELEGPDTFMVLLRVVDKQVERVRIFSEGCRLDAGGRTVTWLQDVRPADSVALLESLASAVGDRRGRVADGAIGAIALHDDPAADAALERLVSASQPDRVRQKVPFWLGNARGRRGLEVLRRLIAADPSDGVRKKAVFGLSQSREADAIDALIQAARAGGNAAVRGEAIFWLGQKAGSRAAAEITDAIEKDPDTDVKKRAVFALSQLPKDEGVPLLIKVARTHANPAVRKQAMFWLGQSKDPRAIDFFAEILK
jgi:hypothetical protein